jgi:hypothetical protein
LTVACSATDEENGVQARPGVTQPGVSGPAGGTAGGVTGGTGVPSGTGALAPDPGVGMPGAGTGATGTRSPAPTEERCGAVTETAENRLQPVDIIFGIDTSGSMAEEVAQVQQNLNAFSAQIIASGIDVRVIMLATLQGSAALAGGLAVDGPCIAPPLGSGNCPDDSNLPRYVHIDQAVTSWDALDVFINAYPKYAPHLRENSLKTFVVISDDDPTTAAGDLGFIGGITGLSPLPMIDSADAFIGAVKNLAPKSSMWSSWRYSGIFAFTLCPSAEFGGVGVVYQQLVERTGGVAGDLCLQAFAPVFDELARKVVDVVTLACEWEIPKSQGGTFDPAKTNVQLALDGALEKPLKVPDAATCGSRDGWHYDNEADPRKVVVCPSTCGRIQAATMAQVDLLFGCQTVLLL